jgi:Sulfatase-modifying factor enzyme 1
VLILTACAPAQQGRMRKGCARRGWTHLPLGERHRLQPGTLWGQRRRLCGRHYIDGQLPQLASPYGPLDMAGNVWDWVQDWYLDTFYQSSPYENPVGPSSGEYRVIRGGSWRGQWQFHGPLHDRIAPSDWNILADLSWLYLPRERAYLPGTSAPSGQLPTGTPAPCANCDHC